MFKLVCSQNLMSCFRLILICLTLISVAGCVFFETKTEIIVKSEAEIIKNIEGKYYHTEEDVITEFEVNKIEDENDYSLTK